jgi:hypothetical protein
MYVRGVQFIDSVLVKEITGFNGFQHPAEDIEFWHPSKKRRESLSADKQVRLTTRSKNDDYILDENRTMPKKTQPRCVRGSTNLSVANFPVVTTRREDVRKSHTGNDVIVTTGRGGKNSGSPEEVSTEDSVVGGDNPPIDFQTI